MSAETKTIEAWPVRVALADVQKRGLRLRVRPDAAALSAIAVEFDLPRLESLVADLEIRRWRDGLAADGSLSATAERVCVVTLDPFVEETHAEFSRRYRPPAQIEEAGIDIDPTGEDEPDDMTAGGIDISALIREEFALALDPHPRKPGAEFAGPEAGDDTPNAAASSPFAVLKGLAGKGGSES